MNNKIERNEPCPCKSGKKYKKCCLHSAKDFEYTEAKTSKRQIKTFEFIELTNSHTLLNFIIGLQMEPSNHGKNVRIEELATHITTNLNNNQKVSLELFKQHLDEDFAYNHMEDIPENLFSENVVFFGGNYTVFAGIYGYAVEIFKNFIDTIFIQKNNLPTEFKNHAFCGVKIILELGKVLCEKFNCEGNIEGAKGERKFAYSFNEIDTSFSKDEIFQICYKYQIDPMIINDFIVEPNDESFYNKDPDKNPLLKRPIIKFEEKYYFILISSQVTVLNEFVIQLSNKYNCNQKLTELYHNALWYEQWGACDEMGWNLTDIKLPLNTTPTILKERVFQFEKNRLAYVCYIHNDKDEEFFSDKNLNFDNRVTEVITALKKNSSMKDCKFLSLITYDCMGRNMSIGFSTPQNNELRLSFSIHQFNFLCFSEKWQNLSIWKFAKSYQIYSKTLINQLSDTLDVYSIFKANDESFYFGDEARPNFLTIVPGEGSRLIKEGKIKRDNHGILRQIDERTFFINSIKYADFAPLYKPLKNLGYYAICLKTFEFPFWIVNHQIKDKSMTSQVRNFAEAIAFWLHKLKPEISQILNSAIQNYFEINIILDQNLFEDIQTRVLVESEDINDYSFFLKENVLEVSIPFSKMKTFAGINNFGEREMMKAILKAFNLVRGITFSAQDIENFIDKSIPLGKSKMILLVDSQNNLMADSRWIVKPFYISDTEVNILLDEIPLLIEQTMEIPKNIENEGEKKKFFNIASKLLIVKLNNEIQIFEFEFLLQTLLVLHESLVWKRERNKTMIPSQILCFGDLESELNEILEMDNKLVKTSLATRCLIEFIVAKPNAGNAKAGFDDIDRLLVLMHEIIKYGFLSDVIHFKLANPKVGKLDSGRIGISREFFDEKLKPFSEANKKEEVIRHIENFDKRFEISNFPEDQNEPVIDKNLEEIDSAFLEDWGIGYLNIYKFCYSCYLVCIEKQSSICSIKESEFIQLIKEKAKIDEKEIIAGIERFSITQRDEYLKAPNGYKDSEVFPWKYNREFSFSRRFIIKFKNEKEEAILTWGFRNAISAQKQLDYLLIEGKLNNGGKKIETILGRFREKKGKVFRNKVTDWLKKIPYLFVIDFEVKIDIKGHLIAEKNYGDIDILVHNTKTNTVYSLECKDTNKAKNIHEMKKEMDSYLGREGQKGMIQKHVDRHEWLILNKDKLIAFLKINNQAKVVSFMLTSEVIPITYIKAEAILIPTISFPELESKGISLFELKSTNFEKAKK